MTEVDRMSRPTLIVVTGAPGAGKTTLAHALTRAVRCPAVSRDEIKEGLLIAGGNRPPSRDLQLAATDAFFEVLALLLGRGVTLVAEAAFQHGVWAARLEPLRAIACVRIVLCEVEAEVASERRRARAAGDPARARYHPEAAVATYEPPRLEEPTLRVDTSEGYRPDFETIVAFACGSPSRS